MRERSVLVQQFPASNSKQDLNQTLILGTNNISDLNQYKNKEIIPYQIILYVITAMQIFFYEITTEELLL